MRPEVTKSLVKISCAMLVCASTAMARPGDAFQPSTEVQPSILVGDFAAALELRSGSASQESLTASALATKPGVQFWVEQFQRRGIDPKFIERRLGKARKRLESQITEMVSPDIFARWRMIRVEKPQQRNQRLDHLAEMNIEPAALHAFRLDVIEDYDDFANDNVYAYFITTHDDVLWGRVTSIYKGLDEGSSVFFAPEDRGIFGPRGEKITPRNHTIVDFGLVESDGEDVEQLKRLSDVIVDLAVVAIGIYEPNAAASAAQASAEVKNLLKLIVELDDDDRLVADTLRFTPQTMMSELTQDTVAEFSRTYDRETTFTHFTWRISFRLLR